MSLTELDALGFGIAVDDFGVGPKNAVDVTSAFAAQLAENSDTLTTDSKAWWYWEAGEHRRFASNHQPVNMASQGLRSSA